MVQGGRIFWIDRGEVARRILDRNGLHNVVVEPVAGQLTDHYDPTSYAVRLSENVYGKNSIAAISVAAHECGQSSIRRPMERLYCVTECFPLSISLQG